MSVLSLESVMRGELTVVCVWSMQARGQPCAASGCGDCPAGQGQPGQVPGKPAAQLGTR